MKKAVDFVELYNLFANYGDETVDWVLHPGQYQHGYYQACADIAKLLVNKGNAKWNISTPPKSPTSKNAPSATTTSTTKGGGKKAKA